MTRRHPRRRTADRYRSRSRGPDTSTIIALVGGIGLVVVVAMFVFGSGGASSDTTRYEDDETAADARTDADGENQDPWDENGTFTADLDVEIDAEDTGPERRDGDDGSTAKADADDDDDIDALRERLFAQAGRSGAFDRSRAEFSTANSDRVPEADPDAVFLDRKNRSVGEVSDGVVASGRGGAGSGGISYRSMSLSITGSVGGTRLARDDSYTHGRIGYYLQHEFRPKFYVEYPNGSVPVIQRGRRGPDGKPIPSPKYPEPKGAPREGPPSGRAAYRLALQVTAGPSGGVQFYGRRMGMKFECTIRAQILDVTTETPVQRTSFAVRETVTRMGTGTDVAKQSKQAYYLALEKLVKALGSRRAAFSPATTTSVDK